MMLTKSLLLLAVLLVAANGDQESDQESDTNIYATLYRGTGCIHFLPGLADAPGCIHPGAQCISGNPLGAFKMARDMCTQIPWADMVRPQIDGYIRVPIDSYIYAKTTVSADSYSSIFSTESDCTPSQEVNPNPVTEEFDHEDRQRCKDLSIGGVAYSLKISDEQDGSDAARLNKQELDCTSDTVTAANHGCVVVTSEPTTTTSEPTGSAPTPTPASNPAGTTFTCQAIKTAYKLQSCCNNSAGTFTTANVPTSNSRRLLSTPPGEPLGSQI